MLSAWRKSREVAKEALANRLMFPDWPTPVDHALNVSISHNLCIFFNEMLLVVLQDHNQHPVLFLYSAADDLIPASCVVGMKDEMVIL